MALQVSDFRSESFHPRPWTACANKLKANFSFHFFFTDKLWVLSYFVGYLFRSHLSDKKTKTKTKRPAGLHFVGFGAWSTSCQKSTHPNTWKIERGMANPPLGQWLGCPSSKRVFLWSISTTLNTVSFVHNYVFVDARLKPTAASVTRILKSTTLDNLLCRYTRAHRES